MPDKAISDKLKKLKDENNEIRARLIESEETLTAIRNGLVDAIVVSGDDGEKIFSLASAETPYRLILEQMNEGAVVVSAEGLILYCNRRFSEIADAPHEKITGAEMSDLIEVHDRKHFKKLLSASLTEKTIGTVTFKTKKIHARLSCVALSGDVRGDICIVVSDITDIRDREIILQDLVNERTAEVNEINRQLINEVEELNTSRQNLILAEKELKDSKEKLEIALESGHIGIWEWDLKNNKITIDHRMQEILGLEYDKFSLTAPEFENLLNEEDLPHFMKAKSLAVASGTLLESVFRTRPVNNESKYISTRALVTSHDEQIPACLTGVCFDVTGMKKGAEKAIVKLNEELLRSNRELESFAYVASHDLQEPLRMVSSFTQMLDQRYGDKLDQDAHDYIGFAVDGAKRMYELLNGLLAYSRIQTRGKEFTEVDMSEVFSKVLRNLSLKISESKAEISVGELPVILADESQIIQLVQNLIENSIKFSSGEPRITFTAKIDSGYYLFSVKDEGIGIEPQYFDRIFKIFQRLQAREDYEGTGIGLAICKRILDRHNGKIWVESEPGKGSEFFFTIPV